MPLSLSFILGAAFAIIGLVNAGLAAWLWTFPMAPDPGGTDPNGKSTAPPFWSKVHRLLGYTFSAVYLVLMAEMVPRLWQHQEGLQGPVLLHALLGILIAPILIAKILVIRKFQKFGKRLPWFGGLICAFSLLIIALVIQPAGKIVSAKALQPIEMRGKEIVMTRCQECHGSSTILNETRSYDEWLEIYEEMQEEALETPGVQPLGSSDAPAVATFLSGGTTIPSSRLTEEDENRSGRDRSGKDED